MNIVLLCLLLFAKPILAGEPLDTDRFIRSYEPERSYSFEGQIEEAQPKQRIPPDTIQSFYSATNIPAQRLEVLSHLNNNPLEVFSILLPLGQILYDRRLELTLITFIGITSLQLLNIPATRRFFERTTMRLSQLVAITLPSLHGMQIDANKLSEQIQLQKATNQTVLIPPYHSSLELQDPYSSEIPRKVTDVYSWSPEWNPANRPFDFLQCTTFVAMAYNLNGINLKGKLIGDARDWIYLTDTFDVHRSNESRVVPQPMDTMVWTENGANHVGIVTTVLPDRTFQVANGNSSQAIHTYKYYVNPNGSISITNVSGKNAKEAWVPSHWLRVKKKR